MQTKIVAHRGASAYRAENTLPAFELAIQQKAEGLELDVHLTKDHQVIVAHDLELERVSDGTGRICDYTLEELRKFNFNTAFPEYGFCPAPTLAEVYALVADTQLTVNVELKTTDELYPEMPEKLLNLEREYSMEKRVIYSSFNHYSLIAIRQLNPQAEIGLLYAMGLVDPWVYAKHLSATALHPHYRIAAALPETVARCHEHDIAVNVWTVDEPKVIGYMLNLGVDTIITNKPDVAIAVRESL
ncbi:MAG: glycerophosphodiester phosphodiesterase [Defluviitaleaceae bacterium]|nr:glycerophosphodiester phosphodiesterase [Defluviitaleaceae bacterium]